MAKWIALEKTWEVAGSALGALVTTTIILPVTGLGVLIWSLTALAGLPFVGALITGRG